MCAADPGSKAIVFSQFTSMLDLCYFRLEQCGVRCVRLQGSMSLAQRDAAIERFSSDPGVKVFLMSLKAGGVALNLTAASHCFLMVKRGLWRLGEGGVGEAGLAADFQAPEVFLCAPFVVLHEAAMALGSASSG